MRLIHNLHCKIMTYYLKKRIEVFTGSNKLLCYLVYLYYRFVAKDLIELQRYANLKMDLKFPHKAETHKIIKRH